LEGDTNFLAAAAVMDYSLLVGVHQLNRDSPIMHPAMGERIEILSVFTPDRSSTSRYTGNSMIVRTVQTKGGKGAKRRKSDKERTTVTFGRTRFATVLPGSLDAPSLHSFFGGLRGSNEHDEPVSEVYFLGVIDFLQQYGASKATEHFFKKVVYEKSEMSCVRPEKYAARMFTFLVRAIGPAEPLTEDQEEELRMRSQRLREMAAPLPPPDPGAPEEPSRRRVKVKVKKKVIRASARPGDAELASVVPLSGMPKRPPEEETPPHPKKKRRRTEVPRGLELGRGAERPPNEEPPMRHRAVHFDIAPPEMG
jgi:hypothetical protein